MNEISLCVIIMLCGVMSDDSMLVGDASIFLNEVILS